MTIMSRRALVKGGTAAAAASALTGPALLDWAKAWAQAAPWKPEKGARINLMRWRRFVEAEDQAFAQSSRAGPVSAVAAAAAVPPFTRARRDIIVMVVFSLSLMFVL